MRFAKGQKEKKRRNRKPTFRWYDSGVAEVRSLRQVPVFFGSEQLEIRTRLCASWLSDVSVVE
jgi:hypothetical protein